MITWAKDGWVWAGWRAGELAWGTIQCWVWENDVIIIAVLLLICFWAKLSALGKQKEWNAVLKCKDSEESSCIPSHQCSNRDPLTWTPCFLLSTPVAFILLISPFLNFRQSPVSAMSVASTWTGCTLASTASSLAVSPRNTSMTMQSQSGTTWVRHPPAVGAGAGIGSGSMLSFQRAHWDERVLVKRALKWALAFIWDLLNWCYSLTMSFLGFQ